jgi:tRNA-uridine 2-sulfurtransferase
MEKNVNQGKIVLGLSGGVDSAVAAYLLKEQGYDVLGVFLKNWTEADEHGVCSALRDREDAMRIAAKLGIAFASVDYEREYRDKVFAPFLKGLSEGVNPNPDILCNPLIKFAALCAIADDVGADNIATGHYARKTLKDSIAFLSAGEDRDKDQSYFLSRITQEQLRRTVFPLGGMTKPETRSLAEKLGLHVADKDGTSGICFIGERDFEGFLSGKVSAEPGPVIDSEGNAVGTHRGLPFYTVGQRHGFGGGGGEPWYVAEKRLSSNTIVVARAYDASLFRNRINASEAHWISGTPVFPLECAVRLRYRQPLQSCTVIAHNGDTLEASFKEPQKAVTPGQYAAFYDGDVCLGSAVIS